MIAPTKTVVLAAKAVAAKKLANRISIVYSSLFLKWELVCEENYFVVIYLFAQLQKTAVSAVACIGLK